MCVISDKSEVRTKCVCILCTNKKKLASDVFCITSFTEKIILKYKSINTTFVKIPNNIVNSRFM